MSSYTEQYTPVEPPEIREPRERLRPIELYADLGSGRPDMEIFKLVLEFLSDQPPLTLHSMTFGYHAATDTEAPMLVATLIVGEPIDIG
jgi:hypothetical protein